ncbi:TPA: hypothetical protein NPP60_005067 [Klebsiella variicola subsp. variicola]|nr:hypothetical protein [Klebsiella variicola subsp. variicola]
MNKFIVVIIVAAWLGAMLAEVLTRHILYAVVDLAALGLFLAFVMFRKSRKS